MRRVAYEITAVVPWVCWGVVGVIWALGSSLGERRGVRQQEGRDLTSLVGVIAGAAILVTPETVWRPLTLGSPWVRAAGAALLLVSAPCVIWARVALGSMWTSGAATKEGHALRTGAYRITRHPIYSAIVAMLAATALSQGLGRWAAILVAVTVVLLMKVRAEERLLLRVFPVEYERYRREVPRLMPRPHLRQHARA
jgi:protein-S-isoprenylcysteine O-methyltransferase Ste14